MHTHIRSAIRRSSLPYKFPCSSPSLVMAPNGPRSLSNFTIGTFNVRGLSSATKRDQLSEDLNKRHIDVCCIQETKCPGGFDVVSGYYRLIGLPSVHVTSLWPRIRCGFLPRGQTTTLLVSVRSTCSHPAESRQALNSDGHQCLWPNVPGNTPRPGHIR